MDTQMIDELLEVVRVHAVNVHAWQIRQGGRRIQELGRMAAGARAQLLELEDGAR